MTEQGFTPADFDWIAEHGHEMLQLFDGSRVEHHGTFPEDQEDLALISGVARKGTFSTVCEVHSGYPHLSTNHQWLGISEARRLALFDLEMQGAPGFVFFPPGHPAN